MATLATPWCCCTRPPSFSSTRPSLRHRTFSSFLPIPLSSSRATSSSPKLFVLRCSYNDIQWSDDGNRMMEAEKQKEDNDGNRVMEAEQQEKEELRFREVDGGKVPQRLYKSRGLTRDGPTQGGKWLSSTTRHVRLYIGYIDPVTMHMDQQQTDKITLILDPGNEFVWPDDKRQKVYDYLKELLDNYAGAPCTEYTLRLIGSDIEHYIRKLLLAGEIKYNLDCRVLNFSMGKPRLDPEQLFQQT